jgi:dual specificity tyrosine-phosphorylation-regulated kinase 2/3/4
VTNSRGRKRKPNTKTIHGILHKCSDTLFIDFICRCFDWDPANRLTPLQALQHEWILQDLPEKVKVHHFRMFGGAET